MCWSFKAKAASNLNLVPCQTLAKVALTENGRHLHLPGNFATIDLCWFQSGEMPFLLLLILMIVLLPVGIFCKFMKPQEGAKHLKSTLQFWRALYMYWRCRARARAVISAISYYTMFLWEWYCAFYDRQISILWPWNKKHLHTSFLLCTIIACTAAAISTGSSACISLIFCSTVDDWY